jgi:hypothetical protein
MQSFLMLKQMVHIVTIVIYTINDLFGHNVHYEGVPNKV